jgi:hypothetical protein
MSNGDDNQNNSGPKNAGGRKTRRKKAVPPPVIEGEAELIPEPEAPHPDATAAPVETTQYSETGAETADLSETAKDAAPEAEGEPAAASEPEEPVTAETDGAEAETSEDGTLADEPAAAEASEAEPAETETSQAETPQPAHLPTARRASVIAAGVIGAILALGAYLAADYMGYIPKTGATNSELADSIRDINRRVAGVESSISGTKRDAPKAVTDKISDLEKAVKDLGADPRNTLVTRVGDVETKVDALAQSVSEAGGTAAGDLESRLSDLENRIDSVEARPAVVSADGKPVDDAAVTALTDRIDALDAQMKQTAETVTALSKTGAAADADRVKELDTTLAAMRAELDKVSGAVESLPREVDAKLAALQKTVEDRGTGEASAIARATAGTLALTALQRSVDAGKPYAAELGVLRPLVGDTADLSVLEAHAESGVPDLATLQSTFAAAASAILATGDGQQSGIVGSLMDSARSLVRVRPTGNVAGTGRGAIVARIEAALNGGDLTSAETEWDSLDDTAKAASKGWADGLKARIAVNGALADLSSALTASLTRNAGATGAAGDADAATPANN